MSRISILARNPRSTLGVLAALVVAVGLTVASGADFTAQSANPSNTFTAGTLSMANSEDDQVIFSPEDMIPGATPDTGTVDIENTGTIDGTFSFTAIDIVSSDEDMAPLINLVVRDCGDFSGGEPTCEPGDNPVYTGTLAGLTGDQDLGVYSSGEQHRYEFSAQLDETAGDEYQGDNVSATFEWNATQTD